MVIVNNIGRLVLFSVKQITTRLTLCRFEGIMTITMGSVLQIFNLLKGGVEA